MQPCNTFIIGYFLIPHLHIRARASLRHLQEHSYASVSVRMNCFHMRTNIHMFVHVSRMNHSSPLTRVRKTALRASTTNGEANDATNDDANMCLVRLSFVSLFDSPLAQMCKRGFRRYILLVMIWSIFNLEKSTPTKRKVVMWYWRIELNSTFSTPFYFIF